MACLRHYHKGRVHQHTTVQLLLDPVPFSAQAAISPSLVSVPACSVTFFGATEPGLPADQARLCDRISLGFFFTLLLRSVTIFEATEPGFPADQAVRIFVEFARVEEATKVRWLWSPLVRSMPDWCAAAMASRAKRNWVLQYATGSPRASRSPSASASTPCSRLSGRASHIPCSP